MAIDIRINAARYYDLNPLCPEDFAFYRKRIPSPRSSVLELGCGTGRILLPMALECAFIQGVDISEAMISICRDKLDSAGIPPSKAEVLVDDITSVRLDRTFDLVTAPYRVFQNLETDDEVEGFFETVRSHLSPTGSCILNVFMPNNDSEGLRREWVQPTEYPCWEVPVEGGRVTCSGVNIRMNKEKMVLYPQLIYRRYRREDLIDETVLEIAMRCYYPKEFEALITKQEFQILDRWGGYTGEPYGQGPELVIQFAQV